MRRVGRAALCRLDSGWGESHNHRHTRPSDDQLTRQARGECRPWRIQEGAHSLLARSSRDAAIFAMILAQGCNLPLTTMAEAACLPYHQLVHTADWYLREATIRQAIIALVNYHHPAHQSRAHSGELG
ncbi:MAG: Tn3 family transposase [Ardenticatenaceae bacterium]